MVLVKRQGVPLGITLAAATPLKVTLAEATLAAQVTPHRRLPRRLIADRGYHSNRMRARLAAHRVVLTSPYRANRTVRPFEDARRLHSCRRRWIVERSIAWFGAFRRLLTRHERSTRMLLAFCHFAAALIAVWRL